MKVSNANEDPTTTQPVRWLPARDSVLTFAVIWDPEQGLETFSGGDLLNLPPITDEHPLLHTRQGTAFGAGLEADQSTISEPFAVLGSRLAHFIDIRSSNAYERYVLGDGGIHGDELDLPFDDTSSESTCWSRSSYRGTLNAHGVLDTDKELPPTPTPKFTLATLLDPETGVLAYRNSKLVGPMKKFFRSASAPAPASPCSEPDHSSGRASPDIFYDSRETPPRPHCPKSSQLHCTNPDVSPPPRPMRSSHGPVPSHYGTDFDQQMMKEGVKGGDEMHSIDDEGFFETSSHPDCEPHLPSRFSTTTTSTSTYITIDSRAARFHSPKEMTAPKSAQQGNLAFRPKTSSRLIRSISFPETLRSHSTSTSVDSGGLPHSRLSNIFRRPWPRRPINERWVLIEVHSVVTDRLVDD